MCVYDLLDKIKKDLNEISADLSELLIFSKSGSNEGIELKINRIQKRIEIINKEMEELEEDIQESKYHNIY
jgi:ElaB/YqjD/DUF883 family membrane-anchored ribosome-binding protein